MRSRCLGSRAMSVLSDPNAIMMISYMTDDLVQRHVGIGL
jgi:hypothetical protein